jgi:hypothetical protein
MSWNWIQKTVWNRWVTTMDREQPIRHRSLPHGNTCVFPCEARLQKWGKHPDGICELCKRCRETGLKLLGGRPSHGTTGHLKSSVCRLKAPEATGAHNACFHQVQDDMSKARSVNKDWEFVSKGTEISLGKFPEFFTPLTLNLLTGVVSTEGIDEIREEAKEEVMDEVGQGKGELASEGRLAHDRRSGGGKVLLAQLANTRELSLLSTHHFLYL